MTNLSHNLASRVMEDMRGFGWPLFGLTILRGLPAAISGDSEKIRKVLFIGELVLAISVCFFLLVDGGNLFALAIDQPLWAATFAFGVASTFTSFILKQWRYNRDSAELMQGLFEVTPPKDENVWRNPRAYGIAALFLLVLSTIWLFLLSTNPSH